MRETIDIVGDLERESNWQAVGEAMSAFEMIEVSLRTLFVHLVNGDGGVANAIFNGAGSTSSRIRLIKECANYVDPTRLNAAGITSKEIRQALNKSEVACGKRNLIAHGKVAKVSKWPGGDLGFWLICEKGSKTVHCNSGDIRAIAKEFKAAKLTVSEVAAVFAP